MSSSQTQFSEASPSLVTSIQWQQGSESLLKDLHTHSFLGCTTPEAAANLLLERLSELTQNTIVTDEQLMAFVETFAYQAGVHNETTTFRAVFNPTHVSLTTPSQATQAAGSKSIFENPQQWVDAIRATMQTIHQKYHQPTPQAEPAPA